MKRYSFRGGIHPAERKTPTESKPIEDLPLPKRAIIPLHQHTGAPAEPLVEVGQLVRVGTKLGEAKGFVSANIHSTICGEVKEIAPHPHPSRGYVDSVVVEGQGEDVWEDLQERPDPLSLDAKEIVALVREAGIVGLGGAEFPTSVKLSPPPEKPFHTIILNGAECEPCLTSDHRMLLEQAEEIIQGGKIIQRALNCERGYIAIEENKPDAVELVDGLLKKERGWELAVLRTKYPQGAEKQLIKAVAGREVPPEGLPMDVGVYVQNVGTACAIYQAVKLGRPLVERVTTVTGAVREPKNLRVRIGTPFSELIQSCGGYLDTAGKIIMGGPMMGIAQYTDQVPVVKGTSGIVVQRGRELDLLSPQPCIRCASCADTCPMRLIPTSIASFVENDRLDLAEDYGVLDCIECGCCGYVCPAKINLVHLFKFAKAEILARKRKQKS